MTQAIDVVCLSLSVPRPRAVSPAILRSILGAHALDVEAAGIVEQLVTEITPKRITEMVREGTATWRDLVRVARLAGVDKTENGQWILEMAGQPSRLT